MKYQLSTGIVLVAGYANKIRRTIFAQLKDEIKSGTIPSKQVAFKVGILNRILFEALVNKLGLDKYDAVRIRINYEVKDGSIEWDFDSLSIEVWKKNDGLSAKAVEAFKETIKEDLFMEEAGYEVRKVGETPLGEIVYEIRSGEDVKGALKVMQINKELLIVGAIVDPPRKFRVILPASAEDVNGFVEGALPTITSRGEEVGQEEAMKIINEILSEAK